MRNRHEVSKLLSERVLLLDGAYGTEFMKYGYDDLPEELNIKAPDVVLKVHRSYIESGSDVILTNTFGATRMKLRKHGLADKLDPIVRNAVRIARRAAGEKLVFGDIGPTGELPYPLGNTLFEEFYENFRETVKIMVEEGVDGIIFETFSDVLELKAAVLAAREVSRDVFLIAHMTFDEKGRSLTGTDPANFTITFDELDVDALGINCSLGPEEILPIFQELSQYTDKFLVVEPNAGKPIVENGKTVYPLKPHDFAVHIDSYYELGVNIFGGCCGTTPEHVKLFRKVLGNRKPLQKRKKKRIFAVSSPSKLVTFDHFVVIGERINPAGRKKLWAEMQKGNEEIVINEAKTQVEKGAEVLDVNFGIESQIYIRYVEKIVQTLPYVSNVPLSLDIQSVDLAEKALRVYPGRPLFNSSKVDEEDLERKIGLLKKYGGTLIVLLMGKDVPKSFEERKGYFEKALKILEKHDFLDRVIFDPGVLPLGAEGKPVEVLKTIEFISSRGFNTTVGLSNLSFGLPDRSYYNTAFLVLGVSKGLSSAIMNPFDETLMKTLNSALVVLEKKELPRAEVKEEKLVEVILSGNQSELEKLVEDFLKKKDPLSIIEEHLRPAMERIGELYDKGKIFLPQLILAAQTVKPVFDKLTSMLPSDSQGETFVIATVKGDVHDIGKNIVASVIRSSGYRVVDLGKDVDTSKIVEAVERERPVALGLSAMMTTTVSRIKEVVEKLKEKNLKIPVIAGGASLNEKLAKELGADYYAKNASEAVKILKSLGR
ncbi:5-methyltetrahydrofolate--homocysteine methyltransferase [Thermotoga sp. Mc24]|uniref:homocysteine S-methyltransferase family protein n=1 Tax=Thermotoga sp. Mc24 TaxID=1231241 RepID=UPI000543877D|nr:homocysteine S-methyltransferase family protein [Thermotoga sp. Mc24]KHC93260.1 5-methyltetrahydrofolate--homocysteine methyltransferase [Thermotoga sp. Mc24]